MLSMLCDNMAELCSGAPTTVSLMAPHKEHKTDHERVDLPEWSQYVQGTYIEKERDCGSFTTCCEVAQS